MLHTELRTITQGHTLVTSYYQRIKAIGIELQELLNHLEDRTLINILLVGLSEQSRCELPLYH
jgi:hypothetical protein